MVGFMVKSVVCLVFLAGILNYLRQRDTSRPHSILRST